MRVDSLPLRQRSVSSTGRPFAMRCVFDAFALCAALMLVAAFPVFVEEKVSLPFQKYHTFSSAFRQGDPM